MKGFPTKVISELAMKVSGCTFIKDEEVLGNGRIAMVERVTSRVHTVKVVRVWKCRRIAIRM